MLAVVSIYFIVIFTISRITTKKTTNSSFFSANKASPWYIVAIGMLGDSISGVTFVSVPGMVGRLDMTYMQLVFGFFGGYIVVAYVLLPLYYRLNLVSIYTYLEQRFGFYTYKAGASFFIIAKTVGTAAKMYLIVLILHQLIFKGMGLPFYTTVIGCVFLIWLYTYKGGMKTILWTDVLQTVCLLTALILIIYQTASKLEYNIFDILQVVKENPHARIFEFGNWHSKQHFAKQFISGIFIVIVMTGLDQNMMQKNLTCRNLKDAQKNMLCYGFGFIPMNYLFLLLGVLLLLFATKFNIILPAKSDEILPFLAVNYLGTPVLICFSLGIVAASFSNADSALTSLTTSFCIDILDIEKREYSERTRKMVHACFCIALVILIFAINTLRQSSVLDTIYTLVSYTYGPLLGLYAFGLFTKKQIKDRYAPFVCIAAPILSYAIAITLRSRFNYAVGYEILLINGFLTFMGLLLISRKNEE